MAHFEQQNQFPSAIDLSDIDSESDDSQDDPTFDIVEEIGSGLSRLSISKKSKTRARVSHQMDEDIEDDSHVVVPKLSEKEQISYDNIIQMIEAGNLEKLKVDQCKVYLRKHGLRVTDTKEKLMNRIREHLEIRNGEGETKYPASSFVFNCKGDACTGDVVLFEQNVYEMFSIASRSATGPPCGTRVVAGRIVKESYGTAKQQHTFTIEVLWSKGEKPHPPLHPLLIKGRNLYRIKTMRQKWEDEGKRQNLLNEKHARGFVARSNRDARVNERDMRKKMKANSGIMPKSKINKSQKQPENMQNPSRAEACLKVDDCSGMLHSKRQPLSTMSCNMSGAPSGIQILQQHHMFKHSVSSDQPGNRFANHSSSNNQRWDQNESRSKNPPSSIQIPQQRDMFNHPGNRFGNHSTSNSQRWDQNEIRSNNPASSHFQRHANQERINVEATKGSLLGPYRSSNHQPQVCRYYNQGRCYFGDNCKYLHVKQ